MKNVLSCYIASMTDDEIAKLRHLIRPGTTWTEWAEAHRMVAEILISLAREPAQTLPAVAGLGQEDARVIQYGPAWDHYIRHVEAGYFAPVLKRIAAKMSAKKSSAARSKASRRSGPKGSTGSAGDGA